MEFTCGHVRSKIFIKKSIVEYNLYLMWKDLKEPKECFHCYIKNNKLQRHGLKEK